MLKSTLICDIVCTKFNWPFISYLALSTSPSDNDLKLSGCMHLRTVSFYFYIFYFSIDKAALK